MGAERIVGLIENRKYRRASVLWPATLRRGAGSFDCVIFNVQANGAKVMIKCLHDGRVRDKLAPGQKVQAAGHPERPHERDYVAALISEFTPLAGDRGFAEARAMVGGIGRFRGRSVVVIGHEKGADTDSRVRHNFGMARPEGYRKARRLMALAERFSLPVLALVDTAGRAPRSTARPRRRRGARA